MARSSIIEDSNSAWGEPEGWSAGGEEGGGRRRVSKRKEERRK